MAVKKQVYINGRFVDSVEGNTEFTLNPATEETIAGSTAMHGGRRESCPNSGSKMLSAIEIGGCCETTYRRTGWIEEAKRNGARVATGGTAEGNVLRPRIIEVVNFIG